MDNCKKLELIPVIRLATVMTDKGWEEPSLYQSLDFANFLNDLDWPTQNRYVIVFNEPNHASEWGGRLDPAAYAYILKYTSQIFKSRSKNFFVLPAGLDAAAPNGYGCLNLYNFLNQMAAAEPDVFDFIDGWNSHAYPNPGFSGSPYDKHSQSIISYRHELAYLRNFTAKDLLIFITETGWDSRRVSEETAGRYYQIAYKDIWSDEAIVAITPFLFYAGDGPFTAFSLLKPNNEPKSAYYSIKNLAKTKGGPLLSPSDLTAILGIHTAKNTNQAYLETQLILGKEKWSSIFKWLTLN